LSPEVAAELSVKFEPSVLYAVPTLFARIVDAGSPDSFRSLRCVVSAGESLEIGLAERMIEFFGGIPVLDGIGSTEVGQTFISNSVGEWRIGTLGKVLPPYEIRVVASDGTSTAPGVEGDIWVRGPSITPGYWNRPQGLHLRSGSWLETGDRACVDGDGWITYRCRADDIEIVGGVNVNPREIEQLIVEDDAVAEAAVVGVRESTGASALQAFLVPTSGEFIGESVIREIHSGLLTRLTGFKVPHRFAIVERLPRTATGKLLRGVLRAESPTEPIWKSPSLVPCSGGQPGNGPASVQVELEDAGWGTLHERLAALQEERHRLLADAVCAEAANMLGKSGPQSVNRDLAFSELGFDSEMSVELRNRLARATGLRLPETVVWDCRSASGLAQYLEAELSGSDRRVQALSSPASLDEPVAVVLKKVEELVVAIGASEKQRVAVRLRALLGTITDGEPRVAKRIQAATTPDEVFQLIDSEFGES
jgi:fatty acid CoA ligase FadD22